MKIGAVQSPMGGELAVDRLVRDGEPTVRVVAVDDRGRRVTVYLPAAQADLHADQVETAARAARAMERRAKRGRGKG